jgi:hypothetical protein
MTKENWGRTRMALPALAGARGQGSRGVVAAAAPNIGLQLTAYSLRCALASGSS